MGLGGSALGASGLGAHSGAGALGGGGLVGGSGFANVSFLAGWKGTDGQMSFTDESLNAAVCTFIAQAQISSPLRILYFIAAMKNARIVHHHRVMLLPLMLIPQLLYTLEYGVNNVGRDFLAGAEANMGG